jgi:DNA polymerase-3 subunit beta
MMADTIRLKKWGHKMKIDIDIKELQRALRLVKHVISPRATLPVLGHVKLEAYPAGLKITGTDLEQMMTVDAKAAADGKGAALVPLHLLIAAVKVQKKGPVTIEIDGLSVTVKAGAASNKIAGMDVKEYPEIPDFDRRRMGFLPRWAAAMLIDRTRFAASHDETRYTLNTVQFHCNGKVEAVASDGRRLARLTLPIKAGTYEGKFLLPAMAAGTLSAILNTKDVKQADENLRFTVDDKANRFAAVIGDVELQTRLVEGHYPNFEQVIPKAFRSEATVDRAEMLQAVEGISTYLERGASIKVTLSAGKMAFDQSYRGNTSHAEIAARYTGETASIAVNPLYMTDLLRTIEAERIEFKMNDALNPGAVTVKEPSGKFVYVFMPMKD